MRWQWARALAHAREPRIERCLSHSRLVIHWSRLSLLAIGAAPVVVLAGHADRHSRSIIPALGTVEVHFAVAHDRSAVLGALDPARRSSRESSRARRGGRSGRLSGSLIGSLIGHRAASSARRADVEQTDQGDRAPASLVASFDGLGAGFTGPQGTARLRNPSDNSLAVGPDHIVQIVNSRMAIFTKKGARFDTTGRVLYGPVETRNVFRGFGGPCEQRNNGDAVARYDQLADRWLISQFTAAAPYDECIAVSSSGDPTGSWYRYAFQFSTTTIFYDYPHLGV